jgi:hypothetical protein
MQGPHVTADPRGKLFIPSTYAWMLALPDGAAWIEPAPVCEGPDSQAPTSIRFYPLDEGRVCPPHHILLRRVPGCAARLANWAAWQRLSGLKLRGVKLDLVLDEDGKAARPDGALFAVRIPPPEEVALLSPEEEVKS